MSNVLHSLTHKGKHLRLIFFFFSLIVTLFSLEGRPVSGAVRKFKCPLKKTHPFCPGSMDLNWTGKGLKLEMLLEDPDIGDRILVTLILNML
jgi:hypothetical protein